MGHNRLGDLGLTQAHTNCVNQLKLDKFIKQYLRSPYDLPVCKKWELLNQERNYFASLKAVQISL